MQFTPTRGSVTSQPGRAEHHRVGDQRDEHGHTQQRPEYVPPLARCDRVAQEGLLAQGLEQGREHPEQGPHRQGGIERVSDVAMATRHRPKTLASDANGQQIAGHCSIGTFCHTLSEALRKSTEPFRDDRSGHHSEFTSSQVGRVIGREKGWDFGGTNARTNRLG